MKCERHILIIEDNIDDVELCERVLKKCDLVDYKFSHAKTADAGFNLLQKKLPDCVLLDYNLADSNGMIVLCKIQELYPHLPVVILTGQGNAVLAAQFIRVGAEDYIVKSNIDTKTLHEVIDAAYNHCQEKTKCGSTTVMIVDDNPDDREVYIRSLEKITYPKYHYLAVSDGDEMFDSIEKHGVPDCVLLDYSLPGRTGLELLAELNIKYPFMPVIIMTGQGSERVAVKAIKGGAQNYIVKSDISKDSLCKVISSAVKNTDLERRLVAKENELREANALNTAIMESSSHLIIATDSNGLTNFFNKAAEDALGYTRKEVLGIHTPALWHDKDEVVRRAEELSEELEEDIQPGFDVFIKKPQLYGSESREWLFYRKDGTFFPTNLTVTCIRSHNGDIIGYLGIINDITEREDLIKNLEEINNDLEGFAYIASHDLKSPLRAIDNLSRWLKEDIWGQLDTKNQERINTIRRRVSRMEQLLDDLLNYSVAGKNTDIAIFETAKKIVEDVVKNLIHIPEGICINVSNNLSEALLPRMPLEQIFYNLITNAIKHHDKPVGNVTVSLNAVDKYYQFCVIDDGPGIPDRFHDKIFDMFKTLKPRDEVEGSGMGLALVRKLVNRHGGKVSVESVEGKGACFMFTWLRTST